jgi:uncharacterized membrane protein
MTDPATPTTSSPKAKTASGLDENVAGALAYLLGPLTGIFFLLTEKENKFVRFHAMQSTILFIGLFVLSVLLVVTLVAAPLIPVIWLGEFVLWIFLMFKAYTGVMFKLPWVGEFADQQLKKMSS